MLRSIFTATLCSVLLGGCFHVQLTGSVAGATLTISPLRSPGQVLASGSSFGPAEWIADMGQSEWEQLPTYPRLLLIGMTRPDIPALDPQALYLVAASGGEDYDPNGKLKQSDQPEAVQGSWHAIVSGQRIMDGNIMVSALTEALYQQYQARLANLSDEELALRLAASAQLVVGDIDENGSVDYDDVLAFSRSIHHEQFLGNLKKLDALAAGVTAGQPPGSLQSQAKSVLGGTQVALNFDSGTVTVKTLNWESPVTAANFLGYVRSGFYDQVLVHRAIENFMIQMGGFGVLGTDDTGRLDFETKEPGEPIINEASNGVSNARGTLSMARTNNPNSARSQFFINQTSNHFLDYGSFDNPDGYAVFARVISGMDIVDDIAGEPTTSVAGIGNDVPARGVILETAREL